MRIKVKKSQGKFGINYQNQRTYILVLIKVITLYMSTKVFGKVYKNGSQEEKLIDCHSRMQFSYSMILLCQ